MSNVLMNISRLSSEDILNNHKKEKDAIVVDVFAIAKDMGIDIKLTDFTNIEDVCNVKKGTVLGCIIDSDEKQTLTILLQKELPDIDYFKNMSEEEKKIVLRRRQRFTVAHEIAHACMHLESQDIRLKIDYNVDFSIFKEDLEKTEYDANVFAGELLIPKETLVEVCSRLIRPTIDVLADIFDVSRSVMKERIKYLNLTKYIRDGI